MVPIGVFRFDPTALIAWAFRSTRATLLAAGGETPFEFLEARAKDLSEQVDTLVLVFCFDLGDAWKGTLFSSVAELFFCCCEVFFLDRFD